MKTRVVLVAALAVVLATSFAPSALGGEGGGGGRLGPLYHTYSIVARDPATGELGVAVQSHWFQVGVSVPWAEAGVGAVATQSFVEPAYGPKGLELMRQGLSAQEALDRLVAADEQRDVRQVAMVDAQGRTAAWTGPKCIAAAGHQVGDGYTVEANLMDRDTVWPAMARAFEAAKGPLAERLLVALDAAQAEGGDIRGRQSAALLVVRGTSSGKPWRDKVVDLRVDDSPRPLAELRRLYERHLAYQAMNAGDDALAAGDVKAALGHYTEAAGLAPDIVELPFWQAVTLFSEGREDEALPIFRRVFAAEPKWAELVPRLPASGLLPADPAKIARIVAEARPGRSGAGDTDADTMAADAAAAAHAHHEHAGMHHPEMHHPEMHPGHHPGHGEPGHVCDASCPCQQMKGAGGEPHQCGEHCECHHEMGGTGAAESRVGGEDEAREVTVTGRLTDEGVECRALRGDDGRLYTLTGDLGEFTTGDRVVVTGTTAEVSICMQGTTIAVQTIEKTE